MDDFPFHFLLNCKMEEREIKVPTSFSHFQEVVKEAYDIMQIDEISYQNEDSETIKVSNEQEYFELIEYATQNDLKFVELTIKDAESISSKRKQSLARSSLRKSDNQPEPGKNKGGSGDNDGQVGNECEYDYYGDTRNKRGNDDGYSKHNKGFKDQKRIYYIKEKREMQRMQEDDDEDEDIEKNNKKNKRVLHGIDEDNKKFGNNTSEAYKKDKKKKAPKKDKVRF